MNKRHYCLGLDIDGCFYNLPQALRSLLVSLDIQPGKTEADYPNPGVWDFMTLEWGLNWGQYEELYNGFPEFLFAAAGGPKSYKVDLLAELQRRGHKLVFITNRVLSDPDPDVLSDRLARATAATEKWFHTHKVPHDEIIVTTNKTEHLEGLDLYLDDSYDNLVKIRSIREDLPLVLYSRPYNEDLGDDFVRIGNIWDFFDFVCEMEEEVSSFSIG